MICSLVQRSYIGLRKSLEKLKKTDHNNIEAQTLAMDEVKNRIAQLSKKEKEILSGLLIEINKAISESTTAIVHTEQQKTEEKKKTKELLEEGDLMQSETNPQKLGAFLNNYRTVLDSQIQMRLDNRVRNLLSSLEIPLMERVALPDRLIRNLKESIQTIYKYLRLDIEAEIAKGKQNEMHSSTRESSMIAMTNETQYPMIGKIIRNQVCPTIEGILLQGFRQGSGFWQSNTHAWNLITNMTSKLPESSAISCGVMTITNYHRPKASIDTKLRAFICHLLK
jgi:hypothetical protein